MGPPASWSQHSHACGLKRRPIGAARKLHGSKPLKPYPWLVVKNKYAKAPFLRPKCVQV